ncbi:hypothetical protein D6779_02875 [Candidatus Parcubacteria bacterium]|nr:MAG: hypothetical protein D6779_02875 [Candidatus Parcubacteria bacterium]
MKENERNRREVPKEALPLQTELECLCQQFRIAALYAFGSRANEIKACLKEGKPLNPSTSDVDIGVRPVPGTHLTLQDKVRLTIALEDMLAVDRIDLVNLSEADPFLAANVVRGERLYTRDEDEADEYDLYVLRRAGDLAPLERERIALILGEES